MLNSVQIGTTAFCVVKLPRPRTGCAWAVPGGCALLALSMQPVASPSAAVCRAQCEANSNTRLSACVPCALRFAVDVCCALVSACSVGLAVLPESLNPLACLCPQQHGDAVQRCLPRQAHADHASRHQEDGRRRHLLPGVFAAVGSSHSFLISAAVSASRCSASS